MADLIIKYPDKTYIIEIFNEENIDWKRIEAYNKDAKIILATHSLDISDKIKSFNFYYAYPITNWYDLQIISRLNPCYVLLGAPLYFDLEKYKKYFNIPIRLIANRASWDIAKKQDDILIKGPYIRPEDIGFYEKYVESIEFISDNLTQEATFLKIYQEDKRWPGNIRLLITDLPISLNNSMVPPEFAETRSKCGQRCMMNGKCNYCPALFKLIRTIEDTE